MLQDYATHYVFSVVFPGLSLSAGSRKIWIHVFCTYRSVTYPFWLYQLLQSGMLLLCLQKKTTDIYTPPLYIQCEKFRTSYRRPQQYSIQPKSSICIFRYYQHVFQCNTIASLLSHRSTPRKNKFDCSGVYQLTCPDCKMKYVGQTARTFRTRFSEHF